MPSRRWFLRTSGMAVGLLGTSPMWMVPAAAQSTDRRKVLVAVFQRGAADGLNVVAPFFEKRYYQLRPSLAVETPEAPWVEAFGVLVEGVDEDRERQVSLELRSRAGEHEQPPRVRPRGELGEQTGLPDPRLPDELDRSGLIELPEYLIEQFELFGSPDEMRVTQGHFPSCRG